MKLNFIERYKIWKEWKACNLNSKFHQLLVLFNIIKSPTFDQIVGWYFFKQGLDEVLGEIQNE